MVQVEWDETSETKAKKEGIYHVRWYIRNQADSVERLVTLCRYWPEIHEFDYQGNFGKMKVVAPSKTEKWLKRSGYGWYQKEVNLQTAAIIGPFNFVEVNNETNRISPRTWKDLRQHTDSQEVDLLNLDRVSPVT